MRFLVLGSMLLVLAACAPPSIGAYPDPVDDGNAVDEEDGATASPSKTATPAATGVRPSGKPALKVTIVGTGTVSSTPVGLACAGLNCSGAFDVGATVSLAAKPGTGATFVGWTGACTGTGPCTPIMNADVAVGAEFVALNGTWTGPYTHSQKGGNGCTFNNKGTLTVVASPPTATAITTAANVTGLEIRDGGCGLVDTRTGAANTNATLATDTLTGTWSFAIQGVGNLPLPFSAKVVGKTMTGTWTCAGCTGSFTLTKP